MTTAQDFEEVGKRVREAMPTAEQAYAGPATALRPPPVDWLPEDFAADWRAEERRRVALEEAHRRCRLAAERADDHARALKARMTATAASKLIDALRRVRTAIYAARLSARKTP